MSEIMLCCRDMDLEHTSEGWYLCHNCGVLWSSDKAKEAVEEVAR